MLDLLLIILFCVLGVITGIATGILPGLHVNNVALIFLSLSGTIVASLGFLFNYGITEQFILILICVYITATSLSHTFHDTIPSTFLGAPEEDTALSVLPAHSLLLEGKGYEAVALSALGSYGAVLFCFLVLYPVRFLVGSPVYLYSVLREIMVWVLIAISILLIATEKGRIELFGVNHGKIPYVFGMLFAFMIFIISGIFGLVIFDCPVDSPIGLSSSVLFPALAGLFGLPTLLTSIMTKPKIPPQIIEKIELDKKAKKSSIISVATGSLAGILVSLIPGISSSTGTILAMTARGESDRKQIIITLSSVNTACGFFVIVALFVILRARSGATIAVGELIALEEWSSIMMPTNLIYLLMAIILSGVLSYFLTLKIGKIFAKHFANVPYALLIKITIAFVIILTYLFTGVIGILILLVATFIGLLPVQWDVRRSHCMGILLIPIILYFL
ncbi:MAG: tripartite tricarboxylate transporter permease [Candidatus Thermoplasmatota archaeon]|nr:tripartite tricarboxylate transporter permease [Candidatus Thermoplasmatota archaeon]